MTSRKRSQSLSADGARRRAVRLAKPPGSDTLSHEIYNQEVARGYLDRDGHLVMLLVAYGESQSECL